MKYNKHITIGYKPDGTRIRKWFHSNRKDDLEEQIRQFKNEQERLLNPSDITFGEYKGQWFQAYKSNRSKRTREMYDRILDKLDPLDPYEIRKVTRTMCQGIINNAWEHPRTAEQIAGTLKQIFRAAAADGIISANPADFMTLPKKKTEEKHLLTDKEVKAFREADLCEEDRLLVTILLTFGLRPGEAFALQQRDFDFRTGMLHITKAVEMAQDGTASLKSTKTEACRDIPIPEKIKPVLRAYFRSHSGFFLFTRPDGGLINKAAYRYRSGRILKAVNKKLGGNENISLVSEITLYSCRHWRATQHYYLTQKGIISTAQAAALMGHSEEVFIRTYRHIDPNKERLQEIYEDLVI